MIPTGMALHGLHRRMYAYVYPVVSWFQKNTICKYGLLLGMAPTWSSPQCFWTCTSVHLSEHLLILQALQKKRTQLDFLFHPPSSVFVTIQDLHIFCILNTLLFLPIFVPCQELKIVIRSSVPVQLWLIHAHPRSSSLQYFCQESKPR